MEIATITAVSFRSGSLYLTELSLFVLKIMLGFGSETCWPNREYYGSYFCLLNLDMLFAKNLSRHRILLFTAVNVKLVYFYQKKKMQKMSFPNPEHFKLIVMLVHKLHAKLRSMEQLKILIYYELMFLSLKLLSLYQ